MSDAIVLNARAFAVDLGPAQRTIYLAMSSKSDHESWQGDEPGPALVWAGVGSIAKLLGATSRSKRRQIERALKGLMESDCVCALRDLPEGVEVWSRGKLALPTCQCRARDPRSCSCRVLWPLDEASTPIIPIARQDDRSGPAEEPVRQDDRVRSGDLTGSGPAEEPGPVRLNDRITNQDRSEPTKTKSELRDQSALFADAETPRRDPVAEVIEHYNAQKAAAAAWADLSKPLGIKARDHRKAIAARIAEGGSTDDGVLRLHRVIDVQVAQAKAHGKAKDKADRKRLKRQSGWRFFRPATLFAQANVLTWIERWDADGDHEIWSSSKDDDPLPQRQTDDLPPGATRGATGIIRRSPTVYSTSPGDQHGT